MERILIDDDDDDDCEENWKTWRSGEAQSISAPAQSLLEKKWRKRSGALSLEIKHMKMFQHRNRLHNNGVPLKIQQRFIDNALRLASTNSDNVTSSFTVQDPTGDYIKAVKGSRLYLQALRNMIYMRAFGLTEKGYMCMTPGESKLGDAIILVAGSTTPFVFREVEGGKWALLGECYVHGISKGELKGKTECLLWTTMDVM
jgi:hypothetical protein